MIQKVSSCLNGHHERNSMRCRPCNRKVEKRGITSTLGEQDEIWKQICCPHGNRSTPGIMHFPLLGIYLTSSGPLADLVVRLSLLNSFL